MARGRPRKLQPTRNTSGLRNQHRPALSKPIDTPAINGRVRAASINVNSTVSTKALKVNDFGTEGEDGEDSDDSDIEEGDGKVDEFEDQEFMRNIITSLADACDADWVPPQTAQLVHQGRPKHYIKGPDVMSKSARTQRRYQKYWATQSWLDDFFKPKENTAVSADDDVVIIESNHNSEQNTLPSNTPEQAAKSSEDIQMVDLNDSTPQAPLCVIPTPDPSNVPAPTISHDPAPTALHNPAETVAENPTIINKHSEAGDGASEEADWEEGLDECLWGGMSLESWEELATQIATHLHNNSKTLPVSHINQLVILRCFAILRMKGMGWIDASQAVAHQHTTSSGSYLARKIRALARYYQTFKRLPEERRGGIWPSLSLLTDERIQAAARTWLESQPTGSVTPRLFCKGLNSEILPALLIDLKRPLSERTARRWLIKLGWRLTVLRKGVYMDGHERADVVEYRQNVFLPKMKEFEHRMAQYEVCNGQLQRIPPSLQPGEREIIPNFQDESCFAVNDYKKSAWMKKDQTILQRKGRGRLIHVSDFINPEEGRLVSLGPNGEVADEARVVIYPGANGDAWWDMDQLVKQVEHAIEVFEKQHPNCMALFVFDQSSAHASLPHDALKAWDMNKSDGGKQRMQRDTVIPQSNPHPAYRGIVQKMTLPNGEPKGLKTVLEERGFDVRHMRAKCSPVCPIENIDCCMARLLSHQDDFAHQESMLESIIRKAGHECIFLPKFHCELNPIEMYWGWVKYRYRETPKATFQEAKNEAHRWLNACPPDTIRSFINRTWRFMDAYQRGLTGRAAAWAVRKQKAHRHVSQSAMMALDAILN